MYVIFQSGSGHLLQKREGEMLYGICLILGALVGNIDRLWVLSKKLRER